MHSSGATPRCFAALGTRTKTKRECIRALLYQESASARPTAAGSRGGESQVSVIFLSALDESLDKVKAFNVGGADYVTKPFQIEEVLARVKHQIRLQQLQKKCETAAARSAIANAIRACAKSVGQKFAGQCVEVC